MTRIRDVHAELNQLVGVQSAAVDSLASAVKNIQTDRSSAQRLLKSGVNALVIADDAGRYSALTRAAEGTGTNFDQIVADWTQQDIDNRKERQDLGEKWGSRQDVAGKEHEFKSNVDLHDEALQKVSPEIRQFDETTSAIRAHNEKYAKRPSAQITRENHDGFETLGGGLKGIKGFFKATWRLMQAAVGFLGPWRAYRIMSKYNKQYGDYFEDAADIASLRENEKKLKADRADLYAQYSHYHGIGSRMDTLDGSYKGPEGIARGVRQIAESLAWKSDKFVDGLLTEIPGAAAQATALGKAKEAVLEVLESKTAKQLSAAEATYNKLKETAKYVGNALDTVGGEYINYSLENVKTEVATASRLSRSNAATANTASDSIDEYTAPANASRLQMVDAVATFGTVRLGDNELQISFTNLRNAVDTKVEEYEAEQRRLAAIAAEKARKAAEEARQRQSTINDSFNTVSRIGERHSSPSVSPSPGFSVGGGSSGITHNTGFKVGGGGAGIRR